MPGGAVTLGVIGAGGGRWRWFDWRDAPAGSGPRTPPQAVQPPGQAVGPGTAIPAYPWWRAGICGRCVDCWAAMFGRPHGGEW